MLAELLDPAAHDIEDGVWIRPQFSEKNGMLLRASSATVHYDRFTLGPIDLAVQKGERSVLVGRNGAGKSTLLGALSGRVKLSSGSIEIADLLPNADHLVELRTIVAYVGDTRSSFPWMTVKEHFAFLSRIYPMWSMPAALELADRLELSLESVTGVLSRGNTVKLNLCSAFGQTPSLLLLDEPTAGLDPIARTAWLSSMAELLQEKPALSVIYATHLLDEISQVGPAAIHALTDGGLASCDCREQSDAERVRLAEVLLSRASKRNE